MNDTVYTAFSNAVIGYACWDWHELFFAVDQDEPVFPLIPGRLKPDKEAIIARVRALIDVLLVQGIDAPSHPVVVAIQEQRQRTQASSSRAVSEPSVIDSLRNDGTITASPRGNRTAFPIQFGNGLIKGWIVQGFTRLEASRSFGEHLAQS